MFCWWPSLWHGTARIVNGRRHFFSRRTPWYQPLSRPLHVLSACVSQWVAARRLLHIHDAGKESSNESLRRLRSDGPARDQRIPHTRSHIAYKYPTTLLPCPVPVPVSCLGSTDAVVLVAKHPQGNWVYDLDSTLAFPTQATQYMAQAFRRGQRMEERFRQ